MAFQGKPERRWPRSHSAAPSPAASAKMRRQSSLQRSCASATPRPQKSASPAGSRITATGKQPGELVRLDQEGVADPPEPGEEIAEAEPPADREGRPEPPDAAAPRFRHRAVDQPDQDRQRDPEDRKDEERRHRERRERARAEGDAASSPAPGQDDGICQAIHGLRRFVPPIRSIPVADGCGGQNQGDADRRRASRSGAQTRAAGHAADRSQDSSRWLSAAGESLTPR